MFKPIKWLFSIILSIVVAVLLAIVLVPKVIDPNDYRVELSQLVLEKTGRILKLDGDLSVSLFPWIGIKTQQLSLSQPEQMGVNEPPMLRVDAAQLRVKFLPLLSKRVEIDTIVLNSPQVNLITLKNGVDSFMGWSQHSQEMEKNKGASEESDTEQAGKMAVALVVQGISLKEGKFLWDDRLQRSKVLLRDVTIETGDLLSGQFVPITAHGQAFNYSPDVALEETVPLDLVLEGQAKIEIETAKIGLISFAVKLTQGVQRADATFDKLSFTQGQSVQLQGVEFNASINVDSVGNDVSLSNELIKIVGQIDGLDYQLEQEKVSVRDVNVSGVYQQRDFSFNVPQTLVNLRTEYLLAEQVKIQSDDFQASLDDLKINKLMSEPALSTALTLAPFDLKQLLSDLQVAYRPMGENALRRVFLSSNVQLSMGSVVLEQLDIGLDNSNLRGYFQLKDFNKPEATFALTLDQFNVDHYLPISLGALPDDSMGNDSLTGAQALVVPIAMFKEVNANGQFKAQQLVANGVLLTDVNVVVKSSSGKVTITPKANLYNGSLGGTIEYLEQSDGEEQLHFKNKISLVDLAGLLTDAHITEQLKGIGSLELDFFISDKGGVQTNKGTLKLLAKDGAIKGVDVQKIVEEGYQSYNKLRGKDVEQGHAQVGDETKFAELLGTFTIDDFYISNNDFTLKAPLFRVSGEGDINLVDQSLDYLVSVVVVNSFNGQGGEALDDLKGVRLPIRFKGPLRSPDYSLDLKALYKAVAEKKINAKKDEYLQRKLGLENASKLSAEDILKQTLIKKANEKYAERAGGSALENGEQVATEGGVPPTTVVKQAKAESLKAEQETNASTRTPDVQTVPEQTEIPQDRNEAFKQQLKNKVLEELFK